MGCCLLAALIISGVRRAWYALPGRTAPVVGFAPPAFRAAPGAPVATTVSPLATISSRRIGWPLVVALTTVAYALLVSGLLLVGVLRAGDSPSVPGLVRDLILALVVAASALIAFGTRRPPTSRTDATAVALSVAGAVWTVLAVVDMHLVGLVETGRPALLADLLVHGTGLALLFPGLALLRAPRLSRLPRHEGALP